MLEPVVIDKFTYKIMKYLYRHEGLTVKHITVKFGIAGFQSLIYIAGSHLACVQENNKYSYDVKENSSSVYLTIEGNAYVENRRYSSLRWFVTTVVSVFALITSVFSIIVK